MNQQKNNLSSLSIYIAAMAIFGSIGIFRRYIPLPSGTLAFFRGLLGAAFLFLFAAATRHKLRTRIRPSKLLLMVISGGLMGINWMLLFEAYNYTTVSTATLCYYMEPIIFILGSALIFREKLTLKKSICSILAFIGMVLISGIVESGMPQQADLYGIALGLGAAVLYASVVMLNRKLSEIDAYQKTIIQLLMASLVLVPYLLMTGSFDQIQLDTMAVIMLLTVCIIHTGLAYAMYFGSMGGLQTQTIAIFSYLDPILALVLSYLILHEKMTGLGVLGALLILGSAIACEFSPKQKEA